MDTFKRNYKAIMSRLRIEAKTNRAVTINILINLKSNGVNVYEGENRNQLLFILRRNKTWNGDVRHYFQDKYPHYSEHPRRIALFSNQYNQVFVDDMPF